MVTSPVEQVSKVSSFIIGSVNALSLMSRKFLTKAMSIQRANGEYYAELRRHQATQTTPASVPSPILIKQATTNTKTRLTKNLIPNTNTV